MSIETKALRKIITKCRIEIAVLKRQLDLSEGKLEITVNENELLKKENERLRELVEKGTVTYP